MNWIFCFSKNEDGFFTRKRVQQDKFKQYWLGIPKLKVMLTTIRTDRYDLFLDDQRNPEDTEVLATNFAEFKKIVSFFGTPKKLSMDHDLGNGPNGFDALRWFRRNFFYYENVHEIHLISSNPVGRGWMKDELITWWADQYDVCNH